MSVASSMHIRKKVINKTLWIHIYRLKCYNEVWNRSWNCYQHGELFAMLQSEQKSFFFTHFSCIMLHWSLKNLFVLCFFFFLLSQWNAHAMLYVFIVITSRAAVCWKQKHNNNDLNIDFGVQHWEREKSEQRIA